MTKQKSK